VPARIDPRVWYDKDVLVNKQYPSAFFGTTLVPTLHKLDVDTVLLMRVASSGCVRASVVNSFSYVFRTLIVEDVAATRTSPPMGRRWATLGRRYADILDAAEVAKELEIRAV